MEEIECGRRRRSDGRRRCDDDDDDASSSSSSRNRCEFMALDLSDAESIDAFAKRIQKEIQTLGYFSQQRRIEHVGRV